MSDVAAALRWLEGSPFAAALGVLPEKVAETEVRLRLPYRDGNTNPGRVLHGGVAASLISLSGQALARAALGAGSGPWHTAGVQVAYLAAAIGEEVIAHARLLRKGRELCFVEVSVDAEDGKPVARGLSTLRGRFGADDAVLCRTWPDDGRRAPGVMGPHVARTPFMGRLGIAIEHMQDGLSRVALPFREENSDEAGGVDEGAVLALLDTTGAMAAWAETGPGRFKASTPALQAQIVAPPPGADLVGRGRVAQRDRELFLCDVEVSARDLVIARGTVIYRILTE